MEPDHWPGFEIEHKVNVSLGFTRVQGMISGGAFDGSSAFLLPQIADQPSSSDSSLILYCLIRL